MNRFALELVSSSRHSMSDVCQATYGLSYCG